MLVASPRIQFGGDRAAHQRVRSLDRVHGLAQSADLGQALFRAGRVLAGHHHLRQRAVICGAGGMGAHDTLDLACGRRDLARGLAVSDDPDRLRLARREMRRQRLQTRRGLRLHPELLQLVQADRSAKQSGRHDREQREPHQQTRHGTLRHLRGDRAPGPPLIGFLSRGRDERPEHSAPAHREERRQHEQHRGQRNQQPERGRNAEAARHRDGREQQREQREHHRDVRGEDREHRLAPGHAQCHPIILGALQFLPIPGDQQQGVVRARTEHEHAHDARIKLQIPERPRRRSDPSGEPVGQGDHDQRDQPQHRRTVGDDQQDRHDQDRHQQQREVRTLERRRNVRAERRATRDVQHQPTRCVRADLAPEFLDDLPSLGIVRTDGDRSNEHRSPPIRAHHRPRRLACRLRLEHRKQTREGFNIRVGKLRSLLAGGHHEHRLAIRVGELLHQLAHLHRLRTHRSLPGARRCLRAAENTEQHHHHEHSDTESDPRATTRGQPIREARTNERT